MKRVTFFASAAFALLVAGPALACMNDTCSNLSTTPGANALRPQQEAGADRAATPRAPGAVAPLASPMSKDAPSFTGSANRGGKCGTGAACN